MPPIRSGSTSGRSLEVGDRGLDVSFAAPAPAVRLALAVALAAAVEEQHAVAVAGEHARLGLRAVAAGERDHGRTVLGRHVPALELEPVGGGERDVLVGDAEVVRGDDGSSRVRGDVAQSDRDDDRGRDDEAGDAQQRPAWVAPPAAAVGPARAPQRGDAECEQQRAGGEAQQPREVIAGRADLAGVVEALDSPGDAERAERQCQRAAPPAAQARMRPGSKAEQGERDEPADEMVARRGAGLRLQVVVVDHVQREQGDPCQEQDDLPASSTLPRTRRGGPGDDGGWRQSGGHGVSLSPRARSRKLVVRRSYSAGWVRRPAVWPVSGSSHSSTVGPPASR